MCRLLLLDRCIFFQIGQIFSFYSKVQVQSMIKTNSLVKSKERGNQSVQHKDQEQVDPHHIAIAIKNPQRKVIYYHPLNHQSISTIKNKHKIFHPKDWNIRDFMIGKYLGCGKYGKVYLVKERKSKLILALKCLSKQKILQQQIINQVRRQIEIHSHLRHKNILSMYGFFFDLHKIYIMMEYSAQGDLYALLKRKRKFDEQTVKKWMKQMISAFHYLQSMNIIHRDIKPENIMVSDDGSLKLSDFGWSIKSKTNYRNTFCGTPDYFCPQIIRYKPFDKKVDNWSLGILAYQLLCGNPPFYAPERKKMYEMILRHDISFPNFASERFRDFVGKLTKKDPKQRMELSEAMKHPWLSDNMQDENVQM